MQCPNSNCNKRVPENVHHCPYCGEVIKKGRPSSWSVLIILVIGLAFGGGYLFWPSQTPIPPEPGNSGTATAVAKTATALGQAMATTERQLTLTAQALEGASAAQKQTATAEAKTATAEAQATATAQAETATAEAIAKASAAQKQTATAEAKTATAEAQATATARARATATAETRLTATAIAAAQEKISDTVRTNSQPITCSNEPRGIFYDIWARYKNQLGCPHQTEPIGDFWAEQPFQNGHMFWSKNAQLYLITIGGNSGTWQLFPEDDSIWKEGMPELSCNVQVPSGLVQPVRGFGGLWCTHSDIREQIGWGTDVERGFEDGIDLIQGFEGGIIFRDSDGQTRGLAYVMFWDDKSFFKENY